MVYQRKDPKDYKPRGFAAMKLRDPARQREIAASGGAAVPADMRSFAKDRDLAVRAGVKGGENSKGGGRPVTVKR